MDMIIAYKYVHLLGSHLENFKKTHDGLYNFRCPICGDSKDKKKTRGYLIFKAGKWFFYCHNCLQSLSFYDFVQAVDDDLFREMKRELFGLYKAPAPEPEMPKVPKWILPLVDRTPKISDLPSDHPAVSYLSFRGVPVSSWERVLWTDSFSELVSETIPEKYSGTYLPEKGIVFPLYDLSNRLTGYQIRSIEKDCPKSRRFVICSINEDHGFFGFNFVDPKKDVYVVEGCIDSLFLPNSIATCSARLLKYTSDNCIYFNDNEPRNTHVCKQIKACVDSGKRVILLPRKYEGMDVNDLHKSGLSVSQILELFKKHTFSGLAAKVEFSKWSR